MKKEVKTMFNYICSNIENIAVFFAAISSIGFMIFWSHRNLGNRMDKVESRIDNLEERMFYLATGKTLAQAILDEKMKKAE